MMEMFYSKAFKPFVLDEVEAADLNACAQLDGSSTTNTEVKTTANIDMRAADIGMIMSRLRAVKLVTYAHSKRGRMATGSGRYVVQSLSDYFGSVCNGEEERLP